MHIDGLKRERQSKGHSNTWTSCGVFPEQGRELLVLLAPEAQPRGAQCSLVVLCGLLSDFSCRQIKQSLQLLTYIFGQIIPGYPSLTYLNRALQTKANSVTVLG